MSINLHLYASVDAISKVGTHHITEEFELYQTPTEITEMILTSKKIKEAYIEWAKQFEEIILIPVYAKDDPLGMRDSIGSKEVNSYQEHIKALEAWLDFHKDWDISWESF